MTSDLKQGSTMRSVASHSRAADRIVRALEQQIVSGELPKSSPLPAERDLMARFGTSRSVVREAIGALVGEGLVDHRPRCRPVVREPGADAVLDTVDLSVRHLLSQPGGVRNLYYTRIFVERTLVRDAALGARPTDLDELSVALAENYSAIEDSALFYRTDMALHAVFYRISGNPILPAVHRAYTSWLSPHWQRMQRSREHNLTNYEAHKSICDAIASGNPDTAERALVSHLNAAWEFVRHTFDGS